MVIILTTVVLDGLFLAVFTGIAFHALMRFWGVQPPKYGVIGLLFLIFMLIETAYFPAFKEMDLMISIGNAEVAGYLGVGGSFALVDFLSFGTFELIVCLAQAFVGAVAGKYIISKC